MDKSFEELLSESVDNELRKKNDIIEGEVYSIKGSLAIINIGLSNFGFVKLDDLKPEYSSFPFKKGDVEKFLVVVPDNGFGETLLSYKMARNKEDEKLINNSLLGKSYIEATVVEDCFSGYVLKYHFFSFYLPKNLTCSKNISVGDNIKVMVIKNQQKASTIVSEKHYIDKFEKGIDLEKCINDLNIGDVVKGKVKKVVDFGVFVDVGFTDALIHKHQASWDLSLSYKDILKDDTEFDFFIYSIDKKEKRLNLTLRNYLTNNSFLELQSLINENKETYGLFKLKEIKSNGVVLTTPNSLDFYIKNKDLPCKNFIDDFEIGDVVDIKPKELLSDGTFVF